MTVESSTSRRHLMAALGGSAFALYSSKNLLAQPSGVSVAVDNFTEMAVSPDGRYLAVNLYLPERPEDLSIIDLHEKTGWFLKASKRGLLSQPAFSHDGARLALIWTSPPYWKESQVWLTDMRGTKARTYGEPGRTFRFPSFSSDGQRLVGFRDAYSHPTISTYHPAYANPPANNGLFEIDLASGKGRFISTARFVGVFRAAYDPHGRGVFLDANEMLVPDPASPNDPNTMMISPMELDYLRKNGYPQNFLIRYGQVLTSPPAPYAPAAIAGLQATFQGVTDRGDVLLRASLSPNGPTVLELFDGSKIKVLATASGDMNGGVITPNGKYVVTGGFSPIPRGANPRDPKFKIIRMIEVSSGVVASLRASDIQFKNTYSLLAGG